MAESELGLDVEFGHGLFLMGEIEEGIVAEAVHASWCGEDLAFDGAVADGEDLSVMGSSEDAVVSRSWIGVGDFAKGFEETEVVALICCRRGGALEILVISVTGGADAGRSVERVDFKAGVVGDDDFAGGMTGIVDGLEAGVAFECGFVFYRGEDMVEFGEWGEGDVRREGGSEVAELARVGSGDVESWGDGHSPHFCTNALAASSKPPFSSLSTL